MREEESNWFTKWEEDLPTPDELMPISQTLITPDLAMAFDIRSANYNTYHQNNNNPLLSQHNMSHHTGPNSGDLDSNSAELGPGAAAGVGGGAGSGSGGGSDEPARTLKRPRLVWTPQLHKRFVDAVAHLGIKNAVPKTIMQLMSVDGLTRENVASHLQKYRLYLKRMQGINNNCGGLGAGGGGPGSGSGDLATDQLFASSPVPAHFLHQSGHTSGCISGGGVGNGHNSEPFMPYMQVGAGAGVGVGVAALHPQQIAGVMGRHPQIQVQYQSHRQMGNFEHNLFLTRQGQAQLGPSRNGGSGLVQSSGYVEDVESGTVNGRKVLTLFPTGND